MPAAMATMAWHALTLLLEPARLGILVIGVVIGPAIGALPGLSGIVGWRRRSRSPIIWANIPPRAPPRHGGEHHLDGFHQCRAVRRAGSCRRRGDGDRRPRDGAKGEAGRAFGAGFASSLAGGIVGAIVLAISIPVLRPIMLAIGSPELLAFTLFGMSMGW